MEAALDAHGIGVGDEIADEKGFDLGGEGVDGAGEEVDPDERYVAE